MKDLLFFCAMCITLSGCMVAKTPSYVRKSIGYYDSTETGIRDLIDIDGCFIYEAGRNISFNEL